MSKATYYRLILSAAALLAASSAFAQVEIQLRPRQLPGWDHHSREGRCAIRVWVDNRAEVRLRGDGIHVRTVEGAPARDEGSECSQPIPYNSVSGFQIRQTAGRNQVTLAQEPSRMNNYTAMVAIEDPQSGGDSYAFEVSWRSEGDVADAPAPFFDDVRACQEMVRQRFLTQNGRGAYIDFETFAQRGQNQNRGQGRDEMIQGRGSARTRYESRDLTYSCIVDTQRRQVASGNYQFSAVGPNSNERNRLR
jgi:hypothetical protein